MTLKDIADSALSLFTQKITSGRVLLLFAFFAMCVALLGVYESYTGHFRLSRLSRATELLSQLATLEAERGQIVGGDLGIARDQITRELRDFVTPSVLSFRLDRGFAKVAATFAVWLLIGLVAIRSAQRPPVFHALLTVTVFSLPFCVIAALIPDFSHLWMDLTIYPIGHVLLFIFLVATVANAIGYKPPNQALQTTPMTRSEG